ncbi:MAG: hypothetical protein WC683_19245, partial [bacterium]
MANKVKVEIIGDASSLNRALRSAGKGSNSFHKALVVGAAAAGAALVGLGIAAKIGWGEFSEQAKVGAQTNAVIKSTGGVANVTKGHVNKLAESLMRLSGVDDEAIQAGENMLLTFRRIHNEAGRGNDIFDQATKVLMDMSVALGGDPKKNAIALGKALNDPIKGMTALGRKGVQFTAGQKAMITSMVESGDIMGAQKIILKELNAEFGGSAKAAGQTLPGKLNILKESMKNLAGTVVGKAAPALTDFANAAMSKGLPAIEKFSKRITEAIGPAVTRMTAAFKDAWPGIREVLVAMGGYIKALQPIFDKLSKIGAATMRALGRVMKDNGPQIREIVKNLGAVIQNLAKVILPILAFVFQKVLPVALRILIPILAALSNVLAGVSEVVAVVAEGIGKLITAVGSGLTKAVEAGTNIITGLYDGAVGAWGTVATWFGNRKEIILAFFTGGLSWLAPKGWDLIYGLLGDAVSGIKGAWESVKTWFGNRKSAVTGFFTGAADWLVEKGKSVISGLLGGIKGITGGGWSAVESWFGEMPAKVKGFFIGAASWLVEAGKSIVDGLVRGITAVAGRIKNAIKGPINTVIRAWNAARIPGFNIKINMPSPVPDINFGWGGAALPNIPLLGSGGIAMRPTLAMIGERGPEAVIPLGKNVGGNTFITVPLSMVGASPQEAARLIWVELLKLK